MENKVAIAESRNKNLDIIRALAVLLVIVNHTYPLANEVGHGTVYNIARRIIYVLNTGGWIGVDLFFVLSGFLVSGLLFREYAKSTSINAGRFLIRRGFKIYPGFFLLILLTFIVDNVLTSYMNIMRFPVKDYLTDLFFIHNYAGGRWSHTWSLDVEEAFYFILTFLFIILIRTRKLTLSPIVIIYFVLLITGIISRIVANIEHPAYSFDLHFGKTHFRLDALFFGVLLSYLYHFKSGWLFNFVNKYKFPLIISSALMLLPNFLFPYWKNSFISVIFLSTNPVCFGIFILVSLKSSNIVFGNTFLSYLGKNSYCIYLWHVPINFYLTVLMSQMEIKTPFNDVFLWSLYALCFLALSVLAGIFFTEILEKPFLNLRDRLYPAR